MNKIAYLGAALGFMANSYAEGTCSLRTLVSHQARIKDSVQADVPADVEGFKTHAARTLAACLEAAEKEASSMAENIRNAPELDVADKGGLVEYIYDEPGAARSDGFIRVLR